MVRDVLLTEIPMMLRADLYAVTALMGAAVVVAGHAASPDHFGVDCRVLAVLRLSCAGYSASLAIAGRKGT